MQNIIGQENILDEFNKFSFLDFPKTVLLIGEAGSGRHLVSNYISEHLSIGIQEISDDISFEFLMSIAFSVEPMIYLIDANKINVQKQNAILKTLEEPNSNSIFIIICENENQLLDTIINRCYKVILNKYSDDDLLKFTDNKSLIDIFKTPGKILKYSNININDIQMLTDNIIEKVRVASMSSVLLISNKLDMSGKEPNKIPFDVFLIFLLKSAFNHYITFIDDEYYLKAYNLTSELVSNSKIPNIFIKELFDNYLVNLKL